MDSFVILDLDDTICDYSGIEREAQAEISGMLGIGSGATADFWGIFRSVSKNLYRQMGLGTITLAEFRLGRFKDSLDLYFQGKAHSIDPAFLNERFMDITNNRIRLFPDAMGFLEYLSENKFTVILFTNGPDATQRMKIRNLGVSDYFHAIYTSQGTGFYKPSPDVYRFLMEKHSIDGSRVMNIGDSIELDLPGAEACGIRSIIVNRGGAPIGKATPSVRCLSEIRDNGLLDCIRN